MKRNLLLFSGNANRELSLAISEYLKMPLASAEVTQFSDGEIQVQINQNVRGADVFVIQPTCPPVNNHLMELLIMIDALKRASADRITAVIPYYGYARQDRKDRPRVPITAKLVADLITAAGASRVLTMDLHAGQIQGFFDIPVDHLFAAPVIINYFQSLDWDQICVVSPDAGGVERARAIAKRLGASLAIIDKRRVGPNQAQMMHIVGEVADKSVIIVDDIIDTAGTITQAVDSLLEQGARRVYASCVHPVLSGPALERIENSRLEGLAVTNTIALNGKRSNKIIVLSVAPLLGEAIHRIHKGSSVSSLFV
ncbi:MAG: ribose-phosphate pyrophosphokinase [candidate division NC10 bacterium]|nr:ribose-phosphate pyrophosphokinase [candidate division NC10 bacterium]